MTVDDLGGTLGIYAGTFVICFIGGLVPVFNAELYLIAVTLMVASPAPLPAVVVLAAAGQMIAKSILYFTGRGAADLTSGRWAEKLERARARVARWQHHPRWLLLVSAVLGLPPFYAVSLLAGALKISFRTFFLLGLTGRTVRFGAVVAMVWSA